MATQFVNLTLYDGDPQSLRSASIAGRTALLFACPWSRNSALMQRSEAKRPGVYILVGPSIDSSGDAPFEETVYIGECDSLVARFRGGHHKAQVAAWSEILFATTTEATFNKAHARRAEHLLVAAARQARRSQVLNSGTAEGALSDFDAAFAAGFVEHVLVLAQTLGLSVFRPVISGRSPIGGATREPVRPDIFDFTYPKQRPIQASMVLDGSDFVVQATSYARAADGASLLPSSRARREAARSNGVLTPSETPEFHVFTIDYPAKSMSMACEMVCGINCPGPDAWRHRETKQTYREWFAASSGGSIG